MFRRRLKINLKNLSHFLALKTRHQKHHIHHTSHHKFTIKTPHFDTAFCQNTLEKPGFPLPNFSLRKSAEPYPSKTSSGGLQP
jgi:hypothetical protein